MNKVKYELVKKFINENCIVRCPPNIFLKGSKDITVYSWQFYLRRAIFDQTIGTLIAKWFLENYDGRYQFAAMETAGPPILSAIMATANRKVDGFSIRKDRKKYGLFNFIEGIPNTNPVIIIDDLANSKSTILRAAAICAEEGLEVAGAMTIVNKAPGLNVVDTIPVKCMFDLNDFDLKWNKDLGDLDVKEFIEKYGDAVLIQHPGNVYAEPYFRDSKFF